jgi:hypothetical protein
MDINPYASPDSSAPADSDDTGVDSLTGLRELPPFASARIRAIIVTCLLAAIIVCFCALAVCRFSQSKMIDRAANGEPVAAAEATASDALIELIVLVRISIFVACALMTLAWIYRSHCNLRAFVAERMEFTSGWAVVCWFVPIANLVTPYQVMREIWLASNPKFVGEKSWRWRNGPTSVLIPAWWLCYLGCNIFNYFSNTALSSSIASGGGNLTQLRDASNMAGFADLVGIVPALLLIAIVWGIDKRQALANEALGRLIDGSE